MAQDKLIRIMDAATKAINRGRIEKNPEFWLRLIEAQIDEARIHLYNGNRDKALAEIADCVAVAWSALSKLGEDPHKFILNRVLTRILPRADALSKKYRRLMSLDYIRNRP